MRYVCVLLLATLAGCQSSKNSPSNQFSGKYAPSGVYYFTDGSAGVYGKAWGFNGEDIARKVAYRRLFQVASRSGHTYFKIANEKHRMVEKGTKSFIPLATKTEDYHSIKITARLYKGTAGMLFGARSIDVLRTRYDENYTRAYLPEDNPETSELKISRIENSGVAAKHKTSEPVSIIAGSNSARLRKKTEDEIGDPLVIKAPE